MITNVSLVIPVFNEESSVNEFIDVVEGLFCQKSEFDVELIFVNDGSTDKTLDELLFLKSKSSLEIIIIDLSRNFGKEAALTAGLMHSCGDIVIPIDVDLQDPPELIFEMINKWREGFEVVLARRIKRNEDSFVKRITAKLFYNFYNKISHIKLPNNVGDFRLMDRKVVDAIRELPESTRFMKGLFAWVGYKTTQVDYVRPQRANGETKFDLIKLVGLAMDGFTSFSSEPLRFWSYLGFIISAISFFFACFILVKTIFNGVDVPGYASIIVSVCFIGGLQLIGIGILGEYLSRTYIESKRRPIYLIRKIFNDKG